MEKTPKYEFGKPDQNDFYDVDVFNNNMEKVETAMTEFDDTGTVAEIKSFPEMLTKLVTGNKLAVTLRNLKAGLQFVLHAGSIVNNCVTDNPNLPLSAAQGKALMDAVNVLNTKTIYEKNPPRKVGLDAMKMDQIFDTWSNGMANNTLYIGIISVGITGYKIPGGSWTLIGCKTDDSYEWQMLISYDSSGTMIMTRCKIINTWKGWVKK